MDKKIKILMTGSGAPGWVPLYKCLKDTKLDLEIYGCDLFKQTAGAFYAKKHFKVPRGDDPNYINTLLDLVVKEKINIILPITDPELLPISKNINLFKRNGILIPISDYEPLSIVSDKLTLFNFLKVKGVSDLRYEIAENWKKFKKAINTLGYPNNPVCFKPTLSYGSRGFRIIDPRKKLFNLFINEKPSSTYITYSQIKKILCTKKDFPKLIVMEYLPGKEYTVDAFIDKGKVIYTLPRLRLKMKEGITIEGLIENNKEIIDLSKKIFTTIGLNYAVGIQFKYDKNNRPKILEINPRLQGTTVISWAAGVNIPIFCILSILGKKIPKVDIKWGVHMYRHWQEIFFINKDKYISN